MKKFKFLPFIGLVALTVGCGGKQLTKDQAIDLLDDNTPEAAIAALGETASVKLVDKIEEATGVFAEGGAMYSMISNYQNREATTEAPTTSLMFTAERLEAYYSAQSSQIEVSLYKNGEKGIKVVASQSQSQSQGGITMKMEQEINDLINDYGVLYEEVNRLEVSCSGSYSGNFVFTESVFVTFSK